MIVDATARLSHYADHLAPTWLALPQEIRGHFYVRAELAPHLESLGVEPTVYRTERIPWGQGGPILVAASQDVKRAAGAGRPIAYQGHGVGFSFLDPKGGRRRGYTGGPGFDAVSLFLAVNERQAAHWRDAYPSADVALVGCPKLGGRSREDGPRGPLVVASFHWACRIGIPEAGSAWLHFRSALPELARRFDFALHAHPRTREVRREATRLGIPFIESFDEVLERAGVYVNDASSTLYEFAAFGGPVVVMNGPTFRRQVHHGLRFWECADVGPQVDRPSALVGAIQRALADPPELAERRREISAELYPFEDPAERAACAVLAMTAAREVAA